MKGISISLLLASFAASGCVTLPGWEEQPTKAPVVVVQKQTPVHPPVKPEQVSDANARDRASQLAEEMEADEHN